MAPDRGQVLRDGARNVQFEALRLRPFAFEVFFFGTAIFWSLIELFTGYAN